MVALGMPAVAQTYDQYGQQQKVGAAPVQIRGVPSPQTMARSTRPPLRTIDVEKMVDLECRRIIPGLLKDEGKAEGKTANQSPWKSITLLGPNEETVQYAIFHESINGQDWYFDETTGKLKMGKRTVGLIANLRINGNVVPIKRFYLIRDKEILSYYAETGNGSATSQALLRRVVEELSRVKNRDGKKRWLNYDIVVGGKRLLFGVTENPEEIKKAAPGEFLSNKTGRKVKITKLITSGNTEYAMTDSGEFITRKIQK